MKRWNMTFCTMTLTINGHDVTVDLLPNEKTNLRVPDFDELPLDDLRKLGESLVQLVDQVKENKR